MKLGKLVCILAFVVASQVFAQQTPPGFHVTTVTTALKPNLLLTNVSLAESDETRVSKELGAKISGLIKTTNFAGLDALAGELRKSKVETASGVWHLTMYYHILAFDYSNKEEVPEKAWMKRQVFLNRWVEKDPVSITARVALARFWKNYAWKARTGDWATKVSDAQWEMFEARLKKATEVLVDARALPSKCPMWWDTMQYVALGRGWKLADYNQLFDEAVKFEPGYTQFYNNKVMYLLPRWFGNEGDWQKFATEAADKIGGDAGDILYARIGWQVHQRRFYDGFIRDAGYSWPRLKKGLELLDKKYPESIMPASELGYLACQVRDRECAKAMFTRVGSVIEGDTWGHDSQDVTRFKGLRIWALMQ